MAENLESLHVKHKESLWSWHLHVVAKGNLQEVRIEKLVDIEWLKIEASMDVLEVLDVRMPRTGKGLASLACIVQGIYPGHMGTYIGHRSGYQLGLWWFSRGLNQRVVEPAKDVSWAGVRQLFEDNEWPAVDYDVSKQEAQMWHHNSYSASDLCDLYHTVHWWALWVSPIVVKSNLIKSSAAQNKAEMSSPVIETSKPGASCIGLPPTDFRSSFTSPQGTEL
ncbi:unnamed protein product [Sphagnum balticum]